MSTWFGKECKYQGCQWEETIETGGLDYKDSMPSLIFCNHIDNPDIHEGNCREKICPIKENKDETNVSTQA